MPVIKFMTNPIAAEKKAVIAPRIYEQALRFLHIPHVEIFFEEYDVYWAFGKPATEGNAVTSIVEFDEIGPEAITALSNEFMNIFREELGKPELAFTLLYHVNDNFHIVIDGEILDERRKRLHT